MKKEADLLSTIDDEEIRQFYKKISQRIRKAREENRYSQHELALSIGIKSVAFFSNMENSKHNKHFNLEHLYKISKVLNMDIESFLKI